VGRKVRHPPVRDMPRQDGRMVPDEIAAFGRDVSDGLQTVLGNGFIGAYFVGSIALGGYVAGESDIDMVAVTEGPVRQELKRAIADAVFDATLHCPARGLEFTLYRDEVAASAPSGADFEVNVNGGPRMPRVVHFDADEQPRFWYVLDRAIAHRYGIAIIGPPASDVFADASRPTLLDAMVDSMRWHRTHEKATLYSVLNASRAWRFAVEDLLGSKLEGAAWARQRWRRPSVIDAAVELRHGRHAQLNADEVDEFLDHVQGALTSSS
jgi:hypothetical protein